MIQKNKENITAASPARLAAFASLEKMGAGKYTNLEVNATLVRIVLSDADRKLYTALVYGVTERLITIDAAIARNSSRAINKIDSAALCALRLGIYQLVWMDRVPDHAAVSDSVTLAGGAGGFVNAVLRSFIRNGKNVAAPENADSVKKMSLTYSVPQELCRRFISWYGEKTAGEIFEAFYERQKISLRINTLKISAEEAACRLGGEVSSLTSGNVNVGSFEGVTDGISDGLWFVQDEASSLCAEVLGAAEGETVADCCAAPGGKSFAAAIMMKNRGAVYSFDLHENKLSLIKKSAGKLGLSIVKTERRDARQPLAELCEKADRVLCDAPCSGLGVIGKKPDIRYKSLDSIDALPQVQFGVLTGAAQYVKSGGVLVYSTCTLNPDENGGVCRRFLSEHPEFELYPFSCPDGEMRSELTLLPNVSGTDGFYICRMRKKAQV